jgi:hypothetical protein
MNAVSTARADGGEVDTVHPITPGRPLLGRAGEAVESSDHPDFLESRRFERVDELCFQQSAGDSTSPQVDIAHDRLG